MDPPDGTEPLGATRTGGGAYCQSYEHALAGCAGNTASPAPNKPHTISNRQDLTELTVPLLFSGPLSTLRRAQSYGPLPPCRTLGLMTPPKKMLTAAELDAMTPDERAKAFDERVVTDINELPAELRTRVERTGRKLAADLPTTPAG